jgi:hypothetical protein
MKDIDEMLEKWIINTIIREQLRELIIKEINKNDKEKLSNRY